MTRPSPYWWLLWLAIAVAWTIGLVSPITAPSFGDTEEIRELTRIGLAKGTHVSIYVLWTVFTGWLRPAMRWRFFLLFFLMTHGVLTEWRQEYVPMRTGLLRDAALDNLGVLLGLIVSLKWWTETPPE